MPTATIAAGLALTNTVRLAAQSVLVGEVQVATGEPNVEAVECSGFPERPTVTGAGVIRGPSFAYDFEP